MISESAPWRDELRRSAKRLVKWDTQEEWTERTYFRAERDVMMGVFSIRRLIDSGKSSSLLPAKRVSIQRYERIGRRPMLLDRFTPERFYSVNEPSQTEVSVARLCNQIVHSFIFQIYLEASSSTSLLFVSDYDKDKHLNGISFKALACLFDYVGREDVLLASGTMRGGVQRVTNITNHDLVESGRARYVDSGRVDVASEYHPTLGSALDALTEASRGLSDPLTGTWDPHGDSGE